MRKILDILFVTFGAAFCLALFGIWLCLASALSAAFA